ncbi:MAG: DUF971 domain-containing protein [Deltaproteobacteria bacterium]|nr:DUF971 domain-containing protein [Deltaproteobacteria bacterium]
MTVDTQPLLVRKIEQLDQYLLGIEWVDGHKSRWRLSHLRRHCPCALCVDEWTGEKRLDPAAVDEKVVATELHSVGRYALAIHFTDGHQSGIFPFTLLRSLCQCDDCASRAR